MPEVNVMRGKTMSKIKIATDSTADIPKSFCEQLNISVLPLTVLAEGKEYRDGIDITPQEFYQIIDSSKTLPVSSQVASYLYTELFEATWESGYTDLIHVTLNSKGSGTYQAAILTRDLFYEEHPEAKEECLMVGNDATEDMVAETIGMQVFLLTDCLINREHKDICVYPRGSFDQLLHYVSTERAGRKYEN